MIYNGQLTDRRQQSTSGNLLTFVQFLFVSIEGYIYFLDPKNSTFTRLYLAKPKVPITKWIIPVFLFFAVSVLNNFVWKYKISVPVHIIFRSGGTVTTMIAGYFVGKRYKPQQVLAVFILTLGVILATLSNSPKKNTISTTTSNSSEFILGVSLLFIAAVLASVMGLMSEKIYQEYGKHWRENLFYTHAISLPFFIPFAGDIVRQFGLLLRSEPKIPLQLWFFETQISKAFLYLIANGLTQYVCVRGVNNLAGNATALTVSIVLNVRKFVSLLLSIYIFGNQLSVGTIIGTLFVFVGASLYSYSSSRPTLEAQKKKDK